MSIKLGIPDNFKKKKKKLPNYSLIMSLTLSVAHISSANTQVFQ